MQTLKLWNAAGELVTSGEASSLENARRIAQIWNRFETRPEQIIEVIELEAAVTLVRSIH